MPASEALFFLDDFGLSEGEVRSVAAIAREWSAAAETVLKHHDLAGDAEFTEAVRQLPKSALEFEWQFRWLRCWDRLIDGEHSLGSLFAVVFEIAKLTEQSLLGNLSAVRPLHLDLCMALRRLLVAVCCSAVEAKEELQNARFGISGEVTAIHTLQTWGGDNRRVAVLSVSLVNRDTRAHFSGSELQQLPTLILQRLQTLLRRQDMVCTGRENEWLLLLPDVASKVEPSLTAARIEQAFVDPLRLNSGRPISLGAKIGAALMPDHGRNANAVIQSARLARWSVVASDSGFAWHRPEQAVDWADYAKLQEELRRAIELEDMQFFLQPQVDLATDRCIGAELLLRWQRPGGQWVGPQEIVEVIELNGWQHLFTDWLIRSAMRMSAELHAAGVRVTLSLNLTAADLLDEDLPDLLAQRLEAWDIPGERFILELTESAMMGDQARGRAAIERLRALGFKFSLDDFGTGYSSLSYLVTLPMHELKIDRSFIVGMFQSESSMRIVKTIIDLANDLGMIPLAEGIDDQRQVEQLRLLGCKLGQGYRYSPPLGQAEFIRWHKARQKR